MADVFVSYARTDKARVAPLVAAIEARGLSVWWDTEITSGQQFDDQIETQLALARAVVVVWTPASVASRWVRGEAREAADRNLLVPVRFDAAKLPIDVRAIHTIDLDGWGGDAQAAPFQELARALDAMLARAPAAEAAVAPAAGTPPARVSICVLPFANMSGDVEQEYFSDGISEDVITDLSKVSALSVVARNTAFTFKGKHVDMKQLAQQLKVSHLLEGSVRKAGQRVRISAQLIDGASGSHVWAERYDRDLSDIFALQDEISEAIVSALKLKLLPEEKKAIEQRGTASAEAYRYFLMARQHYSTGTVSDMRRGDTVIRLARRALQDDPNFARAWALIACTQRLQMLRGRKGDSGEDAARRAIALDANLAEAHAALAGVLMNQGDLAAAQAEIDLALRLDAESWDVNREAARLHYKLGDMDAAIRLFEKTASLIDGDWGSLNMLISCYTNAGDGVAARRAAARMLGIVEKFIAQEPDDGSAMAAGASALAVLGQAERAIEWTERALLLDPDNVNMRYNLACTLLVDLADADAALEVLAPSFGRFSPAMLSWAKSDSDLDAIRQHPRFLGLVAETEARHAAEAAPAVEDQARASRL